MTTLLPLFRDRADIPVAPPSALQWSVERYAFHRMGGPLRATLHARGPWADCWECISWLRYDTQLVNPLQALKPYWWGYLRSITIARGEISIGVSIDSLANRVAVAYEHVEPGQASTGERRTTTWLEDTRSMALYGIKEALLSLDAADLTAVERFRAAGLELGRRLRPTWQRGGSQVDMTMELGGWWGTLDWRYPQIPPIGASILDGGERTATALQNGDLFGIAQSFVATGNTPWVVSSVALRIGRVGTPRGNLTLFISPTVDGLPFGSLTSAQITPTQVASDPDWVRVQLAARVSLTPGQIYWVVVIVHPATVDAGNHYLIQHTTANLSLTSQAAIFGPSGWVARPNQDCYFQVGGLQETQRILTSVLQDSGQFFSAIEPIASTGIFDTPYADGDRRALALAEALLSKGSTTALSLQAMVLPDRRVVVTPEPDRSQIRYQIDTERRMYDQFGQPAGGDATPAGSWVRLRDALPGTANLVDMEDPTTYLIDVAEYDVRANRWELTPRDQPTIWDL